MPPSIAGPSQWHNRKRYIHGFSRAFEVVFLYVLQPSGKDHESSSLSLPKTEETFVATFGFLLALPTGACTCKENMVNQTAIGKVQ